MMAGIEDRTTELEIKLTYAEHKLEELSQVVHAQQTKLDQLTELLQALGKRVQPLLEEDNGEIRDHEKPPHY